MPICQPLFVQPVEIFKIDSESNAHPDVENTANDRP
jgi:hypothetical protein